MGEYNFQDIEKRWQKYWKNNDTYKVPNQSDKPKYYVLDMFPYPSGAGLHVGHPLGYIASDIVARYKRLKGFNVMHPMGFDSFGLPAEQHAIRTGQHPAISTEKNINRYKEQLSSLGFSYDWSREVRTSDPSFYKWTQWIFLKLYEKGLAYEADSSVNWCPNDKAVLANEEVKNGCCERCGTPVVRRKLRQWVLKITEYADRLLEDLDELDWPESIKLSQRNWIGKSNGAEIEFKILTPNPSPSERGLEEWRTANPKLAKVLLEFARENRKNATEQENIIWQELRNKKLGYKVRRQHPIGDFIVDFVFLKQKLVVEVDGPYHDEIEQLEFDLARKCFLEEIGYKILVIKNKEVDNQLEGAIKNIKARLNQIEAHSPSPEEKGLGDEDDHLKIKVYTTRPDTIYGATYMVLAPEHELVSRITVESQKSDVNNYVEEASRKSDLERTELDKSKTGVFTGAYATNPISGSKIPIWISDYVLASYGTGAIMAVPGGDERDFEFATKFDLPIIHVVSKDGNQLEDEKEAYSGHGIILNSGEYNGMDSREFQKMIIQRLEKEGMGNGAINYKLRDWIFSRQRYWGEPIPIVHCEKCGTVPVPENQLPLELPQVDSYAPTEDGQSPLAKATDWVNTTCPKCDGPAKRETNTMPQWGGSCWYYLRYLDPQNEDALVAPDKEKYWMNVDFYIGGAEHAVLHLLYSRFWHKVLFDLGYVSTKEPFQKLVNQGMIQGRSSFIYRAKGENKYVSHGLRKNYEVAPIHVDISLVHNDVLNVEAFRKSRHDGKDASFELENGKYICGWDVEKMSKSKYNVVNPDELIEKYGADTLRMYEMFLGPIEASKPWNTNGIEGVYKFLKKFWALFHSEDQFSLSDEEPSKEELKILHGTIKKIQEDVEKLSLNTSVSSFMIAVNELSSLKCNKRAILEPLIIILSPFAPHISEELWKLSDHKHSIIEADFPQFDESYLEEDTFEYPVSVNGKMRAKLIFATDASKEEIEKGTLSNDTIQKWLDGKDPKKVIVVPNKIVNVVV